MSDEGREQEIDFDKELAEFAGELARRNRRAYVYGGLLLIGFIVSLVGTTWFLTSMFTR